MLGPKTRTLPALLFALGCGGAANTSHRPAIDSTSAATTPTDSAHVFESMVPVPAGDYALGSSAELPRESDRWVTIEAFSIDDREVTVDDYRQCVDAGACAAPPRRADLERLFGLLDDWPQLATLQEQRTRWCNYDRDGRGRHPVNCVTYGEAEAFCAWRGARLPTAAEWSTAARGPSNTTFPWGDDAPTDETGRFFDAESVAAGTPRGTAAAESHPRDQSPFGARDMFGNVREWTRDYRAVLYGGGGGMPLWQGGYPLGERDGPLAVVAGAGFLTSEYVEDAMRLGTAEWRSLRMADVGFRCARSVAPTPADVPRDADSDSLSPELRAAADRGRHSISSQRHHTLMPAANLDAVSGRWTLDHLDGPTALGSRTFTEVVTIPEGTTGALAVVQRLSPGGCPVEEHHRLAFFAAGSALSPRFRDSRITIDHEAADAAGDATVDACDLYSRLLGETSPNPEEAEGYSFGVVHSIVREQDEETDEASPAAAVERLVLRTDRGRRVYTRLSDTAEPAAVQGTLAPLTGRFESERNTTTVVLGVSAYDQGLSYEFADGGTFAAIMHSTFLEPEEAAASAPQAQCHYEVRWSGTFRTSANVYQLRTRRAWSAAFEAYPNPAECPTQPLSDRQLLRVLRHPELSRMVSDEAGHLWLMRSRPGMGMTETLLSLQ